jgi:tetratricopeptide (TPR) repeat protein
MVRAAKPRPVRPRLRANAVSNLLGTPEASRFGREILETALTNPLGIAPHWSAEAWALLANILVNDYLRNWNDAGKEELKKAENAVQHALAIDPDLALAHHSNGLIHRARGRHKEAREAFEYAVQCDHEFARAHAQLANEMVLIGETEGALGQINKAIELGRHDPAVGTFYWIKGRLYFFEKKYEEAIQPLKDSVEAQPNVWYNRLYLASAYTLAAKAHEAAGANARNKPKKFRDKAKKVLDDFRKHPQFGEHLLQNVEEYEKAHPSGHEVTRKARDNFYEGLADAIKA